MQICTEILDRSKKLLGKENRKTVVFMSGKYYSWEFEFSGYSKLYNHTGKTSYLFLKIRVSFSPVRYHHKNNRI